MGSPEYRPLQLDDTTVPGFGHRITVHNRLAANNPAGSEAPGPEKFVQRYLPATVNVSLKIKRTQPDDESNELSKLMELYYTIESDDDAEGSIAFSAMRPPHLWRPTHPMLQAMDIHLVQFCDDFQVVEAEGLQVWEVSFTLQEWFPIPDRNAARDPVPAKAAVAAQDAGLLGQMLRGLDTFFGKYLPSAPALSKEPTP